jgi:hypothetical protein
MRTTAIIAFVCCSLGSSSAWAIDCMNAPGDPKDGWYAWRQIDGRKCWFLKKGAMPAKSQLRWPAAAEQEPRSQDAAPHEKAEPEAVHGRTEPAAAAKQPAETPNGSEVKGPAPPRYKVVRVRPTTGTSPQLGNILLMNGANLSTIQPLGVARKPAGHAPADTFNARFIGGNH